MAVSIGANQGVFETVIRVSDEASDKIKQFADGAGKSIGEANEKAKDIGKSLSEVPSPLEEIKGKALAAAVAIGTAATALFKFTWSATSAGLRSAEQMGALAKKAGVGVEAFSALAYHARQSNLSAGQLAGALATLERNLEKAARTGKGGAEVFESIGLNAEELVKLKPEQAFEEVADAIAKMENPYKRAEALQKLFGSGSRSMIEAVEGGSKAIRESAREAESLGAIIDSDAAKNSKELYDNLAKFSTALDSVSNTLARNLSGDLRKLSEALVFLAKDSPMLKAFGEALSLAGKGMLAIAKVAATVAVAVTSAVGDIGRVLGALGAAFGALKNGNFREAGTIISEALSDIAQRSKETEKALRDLWGFVNEEDEKQKKKGEGGRAKPASFTGGATAQLLNAAFTGPGGAYTFSDVLPGAELITAEQNAPSEDEYIARRHQAREDIERQHQQRLLNSWQQMYEARQQFQFQYEELSVDSAAFFFSQLGALMQTKSKALFEIGKIGAIGETIFNTYRAAQGAYAALAGIPIVGPALGAAAAAAAIAAGMARVASIRSTKYGSTSASPVLSGGGLSGPVTSGNASAALPPTPVNGVPAAAPRVVNVILPDDSSPTQRYIRDVLIPGLQDALDDGVVLNVRTA